MRYFAPPIPQYSPEEYDLYNPRIRLVAFPPSSLEIGGDYDLYTTPIIQNAVKNAGKALEVPEGYIVMPVHELQIPHIGVFYEEAVICPEEFNVPSQAQQSIR